MCGGDARDDRAGPSSSSEIADSNCIRGLNIKKSNRITLTRLVYRNNIYREER